MPGFGRAAHHADFGVFGQLVEMLAVKGVDHDLVRVAGFRERLRADAGPAAAGVAQNERYLIALA